MYVTIYLFLPKQILPNMLTQNIVFSIYIYK